MKYDPPYDSPIEGMFAKSIHARLHDDCEFLKQFEVKTICGKFRLDLLARKDGRAIGFECDGAEFHDEDRDLWRDALILGTGEVEAIYRLRGRDIVYHLDDCLYAIALIDPHLFSERGKRILEAQASDAVKINYEFHGEHWAGYGALIHYPPSGDSPPIVANLYRNSLRPDGRDIFSPLLKFARERGGGELDDLISAEKQQAGAA